MINAEHIEDWRGKDVVDPDGVSLGKLQEVFYDKDTQTLTWRKPKVDAHPAREYAFYEQLPFCDVADVCRFVDRECRRLIGGDRTLGARDGDREAVVAGEL